MNPQEIYVAEYSTLQKCYHISTLAEHIKSNRYTVAHNITNGYVGIAFCASYEEASDFIRQHREEVNPNGYCIGEDGITVKNLNV